MCEWSWRGSASFSLAAKAFNLWKSWVFLFIYFWLLWSDLHGWSLLPALRFLHCSLFLLPWAWEAHLSVCLHAPLCMRHLPLWLFLRFHHIVLGTTTLFLQDSGYQRNSTIAQKVECVWTGVLMGAFLWTCMCMCINVGVGVCKVWASAEDEGTWFRNQTILSASIVCACLGTGVRLWWERMGNQYSRPLEVMPSHRHRVLRTVFLAGWYTSPLGVCLPSRKDLLLPFLLSESCTKMPRVLRSHFSFFPSHMGGIWCQNLQGN